MPKTRFNVKTSSCRALCVLRYAHRRISSNIMRILILACLWNSAFWLVHKRCPPSAVTHTCCYMRATCYFVCAYLRFPSTKCRGYCWGRHVCFNNSFSSYIICIEAVRKYVRDSITGNRSLCVANTQTSQQCPEHFPNARERVNIAIVRHTTPFHSFEVKQYIAC